MATGPLIILSGPSGSGKSTVIARLLADKDLPLRLSVSATTRAPRPGEQAGVAYHFWTRGQFEEGIRAGAFVEWAEVHGNYYGTLRREIDPYREQGQGVILDIDVQGADQVRPQYPEHVSIFLRTSSLDAYEERLRKRGTETEESIQRRLAGARRELARAGDYQYQVVNDNLDAAVAAVRAIVRRPFERDKHAR
jgi:guanylate kinase